MVNQPELDIGLELYWDSFWDLTTTRAAGFGVAYISWFAVDDYAKRMEFDADQTEELHFVIRRMDDAFVNFHSGSKPGSNGGKGDSGWQRQTDSPSSLGAWGSSRKK